MSATKLPTSTFVLGGRKSALMCAAVLTSLFSNVIGCADIDGGSDDGSFTEKSFGVSADIYYSCKTSTTSSDGATWSYETNEVMNLMSAVKVRVTRGADDFGAVTLPKVHTDTFSDGNLTLTLVQMGANKSIEVKHNRAGLFASAQNGSCTSENRGGGSATGNVNTTPISDFKLDVADRCENPCSLSLKTSAPVASVRYRADEWVLAESSDASNKFAISYTFNTPGLRNISVTAFDASGNELATDVRAVEVIDPQRPVTDPTPERRSGAPLNVPYYYQFHNRLSPASSCQNTSVAMLLNFLGVNVTPDDITARYGKDLAQSVPGLKQVFNSYASQYGVRQITSTSQGSFAQLRAALDNGSPVIVHGLFTSSGHVVVVTGYNADGYFVNDPAGAWSGRFMGGYPGSSSTAGRGIFYSKAAFELAIGSTNGSTYEPLWIHHL